MKTVVSAFVRGTSVFGGIKYDLYAEHRRGGQRTFWRVVFTLQTRVRHHYGLRCFALAHVRGRNWEVVSGGKTSVRIVAPMATSSVRRGTAAVALRLLLA